MPNRLRKTDIIFSAIIGEAVAWFAFVIFKNLGILTKYLFLLPIVLPLLFVLIYFLGFLLSRRWLFIFQLAKFVEVGFLNTAIDFGILNLEIILFGISKGLTFPIYKAVSFIIASINSYLWNKFWTFKVETGKRLGVEFVQFLIVSVVGIVINVFSASLVFNFIPPLFGFNLQQWANIGAVVGTALALLGNFIGYKYLVFKVSKKETSTEAENL